MSLPPAFLSRPLAHRALHDVADGRPENSRVAIRAAVARNYGIEIDVQRASDGAAMVFHDYDLARLTGKDGAIQRRDSAALGRVPLIGGSEGIPTLAEVLDEVGGRVPLLIEVKDQDGYMGPNVGPLEKAVADGLADYDGPVAVMSFNPHSVSALAHHAPGIPRGLTTCDYNAKDWPLLPASLRATLRAIPDFDRVGACFISHDARDLDAPRVTELRGQGVPVLCWTIRSPEAEAKARKVAHNVTFEGYLP